MEYRARTRPMLRRAAQLAALSALLVPAVAGTTTAEAAKAPVVKNVAPKNVFVGQTLTLRGRNFRPGIGKNTVAFKRKGAKVVLVRSDKSTKKMLKVKLPKRLEKVLVVRNGVPAPTRLQVRVLAARFGKSYTRPSQSPIVGPEKPPAPPRPPAADPHGDCDGDGQVNSVDGDDDNDLLTDDAREAAPARSVQGGHGRRRRDRRLRVPVGARPQRRRVPGRRRRSCPRLRSVRTRTRCSPTRTSTTTATRCGSARSTRCGRRTATRRAARSTISSTPTATSTPPTAATAPAGAPAACVGPDPHAKYADFFGWAGAARLRDRAGSTLAVDGDQRRWEAAWHLRDCATSTRTASSRSPHEERYYDLDGKLSDDERDEDADGLTNYDEATGRNTSGYWVACYKSEKPYPITYAGTDLVDPDSDGDGVRDGADDQDHDDIPNLMELSRLALACPMRGLDGSLRQGRRRREPAPCARPREPVQPVPAVRQFAHLRAASVDREPVRAVRRQRRPSTT